MFNKVFAIGVDVYKKNKLLLFCCVTRNPKETVRKLAKINQPNFKLKCRNGFYIKLAYLINVFYLIFSFLCMFI